MIDAINSLFVSVLNWIYSWVGNYGWSVVVFTLIVRLLVLRWTSSPAAECAPRCASSPSCKRCKKSTPTTKDKLNQKTMELYRKEHVSMTAGCLPLLLQWPILIFMFTAMRVVANEHTHSDDPRSAKRRRAGVPELAVDQERVHAGLVHVLHFCRPRGSTLMEISPASYSSILTAENIEAARAFLSTTEYAAIAAQYGANAFTAIPLNFLFFQTTLHIPTSFAALFEYANGLFILPVLAGVSQFLMTKVMNSTGKKKDKDQPAQPEPANAMEQRLHEVVLPAVLAVDLRDQQLRVLDLLDGGQRHFHRSERRAQLHLRPRRGEGGA